MDVRSARRWIWAALALQFLGYLFDVAWHGLAGPGGEPRTVSEMVRHLSTVHLPLYIGALAVLVTTLSALVRHGRAARGVALPIAVAGAVVSAGAEAWHAASHLDLDTHTAPIAGILSFVGFIVVVVAMAVSSRRRRGAGEATNDRRAA